MSIYPTLVDLASVPDPGNLEGRSIRPLLANPDAAWDGAALTTFGQNNHAVRDARWSIFDTRMEAKNFMIINRILWSGRT